MKIQTLCSLLFATAILAPVSASAWDFTCSPANVTDIEADDPPNIMMMLDRSGSMNDRAVAQTCRVCERPDGSKFEVASAADCPSGTSWSVDSERSTYAQDNSLTGYSHNFEFSGLSAADGELWIQARTRGRFDGGARYYLVYINGVYSRDWDPSSNCGTRDTWFQIPTASIVGGNLKVELRATASTSAQCNNPGGGNWGEVTLDNRSHKYLGSQTDAAVCGSLNKWGQAKQAIERVTYESSAMDPDLAAFGLGVFSGTSASILEECASNNHTQIMTRLNALSPSGYTPTATAITTSMNSACVQDASFDVQTDAKQFSSRPPFYEHVFSVSPTTGPMDLTLALQGSYNGDCRFATISAIGGIPEKEVVLGYHTTNAGCSTIVTLRSADGDFNPVPSELAATGTVKIRITPRLTNQPGLPGVCTTPSTTGVGSCTSNRNRSTATLRSDRAVRRSSATLLINDGEPCYSSGCPVVARYDAIVAACEHRKVAALYVLGLGSGTDQDYNHILAAAGGTGECGGADPCSNPTNWATLRGKCTGAFQSDSSNELLEAIAAITGAMQCMFDVNFENQSVSVVPEDPTSQYPYLAVTGRGVGKIAYKDDPTAVPLGQGWEFSNPLTPNRVRLTDHFCEMIQVRTIPQVTTHLACLCVEEEGTRCDVPDYDLTGVCPEGVWVCMEGVDVCDPDPECCIPDLPCTVSGLLGVCADGLTVCTNNVQSCEQVVFPSDEVCNGLDDDCDGIVDEMGGDCVVPGAFGRCSPGTFTCVGDDLTCISKYFPMPELCNGLDDDCDGIIDNISVSWNNYKDTYTLAQADRPKACNFANVCICPAGQSDVHSGTTFQEFVDAWSPVCGCGEGLEEPTFTPAGPTSEPSSSDSQPLTGCSATQSQPGWLLLLLALGLIRRRI